MATYLCPCLNCELTPGQGANLHSAPRHLNDANQLNEDSVPARIFANTSPTLQEFFNLPSTTSPSPSPRLHPATPYLISPAGIELLQVKHPFLVSFTPIMIEDSNRHSKQSPSVLQPNAAIPQTSSTSSPTPPTSSQTQPNHPDQSHSSSSSSSTGQPSLWFLLTCNNCTFPICLFHSQSSTCFLNGASLNSIKNNTEIENRLNEFTSQTYQIVVFPIPQTQFYPITYPQTPQQLKQASEVGLDPAFEFIDQSIQQFIAQNFPNPSPNDMLLPHLSHLLPNAKSNQNHQNYQPFGENGDNNSFGPNGTPKFPPSMQLQQTNTNAVIEDTISVFHTALQSQRNSTITLIQQQIRFNLAYHNSFLAVSLLESRTLIDRMTAITQLQSVNQHGSNSTVISAPIPYQQFLASFAPERTFTDSSSNDTDAAVSLQSFNYSYFGSMFPDNTPNASTPTGSNNQDPLNSSTSTADHPETKPSQHITMPSPRSHAVNSARIDRNTTTKNLSPAAVASLAAASLGENKRSSYFPATSYTPLTFQPQHHLHQISSTAIDTTQHPDQPSNSIKIAPTSSIHSIFNINHSLASFLPTSVSSSRHIQRSHTDDPATISQNQNQNKLTINSNTTTNGHNTMQQQRQQQQHQSQRPYATHSPISHRFGTPLPGFHQQPSCASSSTSKASAQLSLPISSPPSHANTHSPSVEQTYSKPLPMLPQPNDTNFTTHLANSNANDVEIEPLQFQQQITKNKPHNTTATPSTAPNNSSTSLSATIDKHSGDGSNKQTPKSILSSQPSSSDLPRKRSSLTPSALQQKSQQQDGTHKSTTSRGTHPQQSPPLASPYPHTDEPAIFPIDLDGEGQDLHGVSNPMMIGVAIRGEGHDDDMDEDEDIDADDVDFLDHFHHQQYHQYDIHSPQQQQQQQQQQFAQSHDHSQHQHTQVSFIPGSIAIPTQVPYNQQVASNPDPNAIDPQHPPQQRNFVVGSVHDYDEMINTLQVARLIGSQGAVNLTQQQLYQLQLLQHQQQHLNLQQQQQQQQQQSQGDMGILDGNESPNEDNPDVVTDTSNNTINPSNTAQPNSSSPSPSQPLTDDPPQHLGSLAQQLAIHGLLKK